MLSSASYSWVLPLLLDCLFHPSPLALLILTALFTLLSSLMVKWFGSRKHRNMPHLISQSPFLSLRPDADCGRQQDEASPSTVRSFAGLMGRKTGDNSSNTYTNGHTGDRTHGYSTEIAGSHKGLSNGDGESHSYANGTNHSYSNGTNGANGSSSVQHLTNGVAKLSTNGATPTQDEFLKLESPQQDLLLLHGPGKKYSLERAQEIPELRGDNEILVQVLAIGLNPVDWKGADYGFSQPRYPWVNGRDFAGIVVRASRSPCRIQLGDVVFGPSTDYRDVRKAAYQEYVVTTDSNVARIPSHYSVKEGAALGVAFVAAAVALGVSFGLDFSKSRNGPPGPDLLQLVRQLDPRNVAEDIRDEIFGGISNAERPHPGEWIAIWGANSTTGQLALQVAKLAGLRVITVADLAKGGARLSELGSDFLVDKYDTERAVAIIKAVTGGELRFGIDTHGKETAELLQSALRQSSTGPKSHILGFNSLPKQVPGGVVQHKVPIKIFHEAANFGDAVMIWLEELLVSKSLKLPEVEVADGGLAGVNNALDRLRTGTVGGRRIVVPVGKESGNNTPSTKISSSNATNGVPSSNSDLSYHDEINSDPDRVKFAYWVPNVSGGLVISKIPQRTYWDLKSNVKYAQMAEKVGFEFALSQIRFMAGYGADNQHEPVSFSQALLAKTERLKLIAALLPGPWNPAVAAKMIASIDHYSEGRIAVNVVSGWFKLEFTSIGQWWLDHAERYRRSREFIDCLKGIWTQDSFTYKGDFYQFHDYPLKPKPLVLPNRPHPEIFQGGNSGDAQENAAHASDYYFMNGNTLEGFQKQINSVCEKAKAAGREGQVRFALNGFVICRETEEEAVRVLQEIQGKADAAAVEGFRQQVQNAGASAAGKSGMWANSKFEDLVQYNDGFKTKLIGTKHQIADRILMLKSLGVDIILTAFLHYEEEIEAFGRDVLPLVRQLERQGRGKDQAYEIGLTGDVYREKKAPAS
nr:alkanesulfonate monooxygenase 1 [Quercus suber]